MTTQAEKKEAAGAARILETLESDLANVKTTASVDDLLKAARGKLKGTDLRKAEQLGADHRATVLASQAKRGPQTQPTSADPQPESVATEKPVALEEPVEDDCPKLIEVQLKHYRAVVVPTNVQRLAGVTVTNNEEAQACYDKHFHIRSTEHRYTFATVKRIETVEDAKHAGYKTQDLDPLQFTD